MSLILIGDKQDNVLSKFRETALSIESSAKILEANTIIEFHKLTNNKDINLILIGPNLEEISYETVYRLRYVTRYDGPICVVEIAMDKGHSFVQRGTLRAVAGGQIEYIDGKQKDYLDILSKVVNNLLYYE